ncbi:50S ribosomal protein L24 [Sphingobacterium thalpophilum]|uniref:Large ribosomal subunit protein uL24 n=1 Tax=Sphingobacterium thalpophilum TaxID=259 RepID=A0A4U9UH50_9SPHI|nr:50S ribosomal protein L24 [Sphingobacterium thalpophilum]
MAQKTKTTKHKIKIKKGDLVKVIAGNSKGVQGKVLTVLVDKNRAIVEGANIVKKHTKPSAANPNGGIIEKEAGIHISNLALIDPKTGETTRVGRKLNADGKLVRYAKKSGEEIK